jgi:hypothetical protein
MAFKYGAMLHDGTQYFCETCDRPYIIDGRLTGPKCGCLIGKPEKKVEKKPSKKKESK